MPTILRNKKKTSDFFEINRSQKTKRKKCTLNNHDQSLQEADPLLRESNVVPSTSVEKSPTTTNTHTQLCSSEDSDI
ncbi:unnamed protein product [Brachionus calyciflorus]|uniref:Uncharacterized protein n=1 Tax=Brachionus calyciflorus TaxID=104777 RepID=A0A814LE81_9BILA|nr:unnamed protein product [Brachionus calyciflorus]